MTNPRHRLLVVDDEPDLRTLYELTLVREGYDVESAGGVEEAWELLVQRGPGAFHLVITDMRLPDGSGLDLLRRIEDTGRLEKAMVITAYGSAENAVEALKAGAYDYLTKPVDLRQFRAVVASALGRSAAAASPPTGRDSGGREARASASEPVSVAPAGAPAAIAAHAVVATAPVQHPSLRRMAGSSVAVEQMRALVEKVARSMAPVLVQGESGTGKELVARAIHDVSPRTAFAFIAVNCGAIPEALLEAEFFGYRKGAFTGANEDREGFFQAAQGGTLFLDEIGDLPLAMQSKLLRVIQERAVRPVGAVAETPVNVRIVSATHKDLGAEVHAGRFRQDLYYRLNVIRVAVPPLRERLDDLGAICSALLARIARDAGVTPVPTLDPDALALLRRYGFPGNVRELENLLHRALALSGGVHIERADLGLPDALLSDTGPQSDGDGDGDRDGDRDRDRDRDRSEQGAAVPAARAGGVVPSAPGLAAAAEELPRDLAAHLDGVERAILERALAQHRYNRTAAGGHLGLTLRQMRYRMARLGVLVADGPGGERGDS